MKILKKFEKLEGLINNIIYFFVVIILLMMCFLAFSQVILRNFFSYSIVWADPLVRMGVLWVAMLGACIAAARWERGHIHIDLFSKILPRPYSEYLDAVLSFVASIACGWFFYESVNFVSVRREVHNITHIFDIPEWYFTLIFPIAFFLMTFKFLLCFFEDLGGEREVE